MSTFFDTNEIKDRINLNLIKLRDNPYYQIGQVFSPSDYDWYGDKEGRALLSFVSHYKISGVEIPCMHEMMKLMPQKQTVNYSLDRLRVKSSTSNSCRGIHGF